MLGGSALCAYGAFSANKDKKNASNAGGARTAQRRHIYYYIIEVAHTRCALPFPQTMMNSIKPLSEALAAGAGSRSATVIVSVPHVNVWAARFFVDRPTLTYVNVSA